MKLKIKNRNKRCPFGLPVGLHSRLKKIAAKEKRTMVGEIEQMIEKEEKYIDLYELGKKEEINGKQ